MSSLDESRRPYVCFSAQKRLSGDAEKGKMPEIRDILIAALKDVKEAKVPEDLREVAFVKAIDLHAGGGQLPPAGQRGNEGRMDETPPGEVPQSALERIAQRLGLSVEAVGEVYNEENGEIELIASARRLPEKTAPATKEIALAVAAGRQAAQVEEWTSLDAIRVVCADFNRLDSGNFATTIKEMDNVFSTRSRSARKREVRVNRPGWDEAQQLVARLAGGDV